MILNILFILFPFILFPFSGEDIDKQTKKVKSPGVDLATATWVHRKRLFQSVMIRNYNYSVFQVTWFIPLKCFKMILKTWNNCSKCSFPFIFCHICNRKSEVKCAKCGHKSSIDHLQGIKYLSQKHGFFLNALSFFLLGKIPYLENEVD